MSSNEAITTPEQLVARATWDAIVKNRGKGPDAVEMRRKAQTIVWSMDVFNALPENVRVAMINHSSSTDVMARDIRDRNEQASDDDVKMKLARRIFGLRNGGGGTRVVEKKTLAFPGYSITIESGDVIDATEIFASALAAAVDLGIPTDVARDMIAKTFAANDIEM